MKSRAGVVEVDVTVGCGQMAENRAESQVGVMASFVTPLTQACLSYPNHLLNPSLDNPLLLDHPPLATHLPLYNRLGRCVKGKKVTPVDFAIGRWVVMKSERSSVGVISGRCNGVINCGCLFTRLASRSSRNIHN